nr:efflux RND transporter periplasmic adaptor subunit [Methylomusa anaerophila]
MSRRGLIFLLLLTFSLTGCAKTGTVSEETPLVRSQVIRLDAAGQSAAYSGEVRGRYETQLAFQVGGKIVKRYVELGSVVNPGDILMEIDVKDIREAVNIGSAQVTSAQSQLTLAATNLERYRKLYEQGAVSQLQLDQYQNAYEVARAAAQQAEAQYAQSANQMGYSRLIADSAGVVAGVSAEAGQVVSTGQPVLTLVQGDEREVEINVPENRIDELRQARQIQVRFWALPEVVLNGQVREISPVANNITRTYKARISLINPPAEVGLGMTASVTVENTGAKPVVYIPLTAVYQTGDTPGVWVVENDTATLRPVRTGDFGDGRIQILDGLHDGDVIVTAGVQKLREGQKVRL